MLPDYKKRKSTKKKIVLVLFFFFYLTGTVTSSKTHFATVSQAFHTSEPSLVTRDTCTVCFCIVTNTTYSPPISKSSFS